MHSWYVVYLEVATAMLPSTVCPASTVDNYGNATIVTVIAET